MEAVAKLLELIVELLKRNYKKPKLWVGIKGTLIFEFLFALLCSLRSPTVNCY